MMLFFESWASQDFCLNGQAQGMHGHVQDCPPKDFWVCSNEGVSPENVRPRE